MAGDRPAAVSAGELRVAQGLPVKVPAGARAYDVLAAALAAKAPSKPVRTRKARVS